MTVTQQMAPHDQVSLPSRPPCVRVQLPSVVKGGVVVACPHSGRFYPPELLLASRLDAHTLRRSEDAFVDILFNDTLSHGAVLLANEFARAFVDVNRAPGELDPKLILGVLPNDLESNSERVKAGLGVIPRTVGEGLLIYQRCLTREVAQARLDEVHTPWHEAIELYLAKAKQANGAVIVIDCHSMPSLSAGEAAFDIILGDRFGVSCAPIVMNEAFYFLKAKGLKVGRNNPYAGGYTTRRHGNPLSAQHALQIEINRSLYMVEGAMTLRPSFGAIRETMSQLVSHLVGVSQRLSQ